VEGALALQGLRSPHDAGEIRRDLPVTGPVALIQNIGFLGSRILGEEDGRSRIAWIRGNEQLARQSIRWIWILAGAAAAFLACRLRPGYWGLLAGLLTAIAPVAVAGTERLADWSLASPLVLFVLTTKRTGFAALGWGALLSLTPLGFLLAVAVALFGGREDRIRLLLGLPLYLAFDPARLAEPLTAATAILPGLARAGWPGVGDGPLARLLIASWTPGAIVLGFVAIGALAHYRDRLTKISVLAIAAIWVVPACLGAAKAAPVGFVAPLAFVLAAMGAETVQRRAVRGRIAVAAAIGLLLLTPVGKGYYDMSRIGARGQERTNQLTQLLQREVGSSGLLVHDPSVAVAVESVASFPFPTHAERPEVWDFAYWPGWYGPVTHMVLKERTLRRMESASGERPGARALLLGLARHARPVAIIGEPETDPSALLLFRLDPGPPWDPENRHERMRDLPGGPVEARFLGDYAAFLGEHDRLERAVELLRVALRWDPDSPKLWHNLGTTLLLLGEEVDAAETLTLGLQRNPGSVELRYALARAYLEGNVPGRALIELREVLARRPNFASAHYDLARAAAELRNWSLVAKALENYLELDPNPPNREEILAALEDARRLAEESP
jgi:hypothetical protein